METKLATIPNTKQQQMIWLYNNPESPTFGNAYQSAIKAGYTPFYARTITVKNPQWFDTHCRHGSLLEKSEKILNKYLDMVPKDPQEMKIQQDTAKFITGTLGKEKYSTRREVTGKDGKKLFSNNAKLVVEKVLNDFLQPVETRVRIEQSVSQEHYIEAEVVENDGEEE